MNAAGGQQKWPALKDIPAYVRQANDQELLELALLENLQREDLNAMEIALSYKRMMEELDHTQEQVAERMGKERSTVTNYIRLLKLPPDIQVAVRNGEISMGHARALINVIPSTNSCLFLMRSKPKACRCGKPKTWYATFIKKQHTPKRTKTHLPPTFKKIEDKLGSHFSTRVKMKHSKNGSGQITFDYYSLEELNKLLDQMNVTID